MDSTVNAAQAATPIGVVWHNARDWGVEGKGWQDTDEFYDRLPARARGVVRPVIWDLSRQSAGMCVSFATDSTEIHVRWRLRLKRLALPQMAATGASGVDLYVQDDAGRWRWLAVGKPDAYPDVTQMLVGGLEPEMHRFRLYLPLYNGVEFVEIGVRESAVFMPVPPRSDKSMVFYGSSIVQGASAGRPGMTHAAILGRRLDKPVINLGFSGNAKMEPEVAQFLAELKPCVFILDAVPNMNAELVRERFVPFVRILRAAHAETPIILIEDRAWTNTPFLPQRQAHHAATREALAEAYGQLQAENVGNLSFIPRDNLYGDDGEASVDGSHPSDLGFVRMADAIEPVLRRALQA